MENNKLAILLAVVALSAFLIGGGLGVLYEIRLNPEVKKVADLAPTVDVLSSKVMQTVVTVGSVKSVSSDHIVLASNGDTTTIAITPATKFYGYAGQQSAGAPVANAVTINDLKAGQYVSATLKILPGGTLQCDAIYIIIPTK